MALFLICLFTNAFASTGEIGSYLQSISDNHVKLHDFFKSMPKGGELHYHYTGSAYPEYLIKLAKEGNYCIDPNTMRISRFSSECRGMLTKKFLLAPKNQKKAINAWSMRNVITNYKIRYDHFFNVFAKVNPIYEDYYQNILADMINRAAEQHELYMEIMLPMLTNAEKYAKLIKHTNDLDEKMRILLASVEFQNSVKRMIDQTNTYLNGANQKLNCNKNPHSPACEITVKFHAFVFRDIPIDEVFAQALAAFLAQAHSENIVGVNLVRSEKDLIAKHDFSKHMKIFNFLHSQYPNSHISLHAGELDAKTNKLSDLCCHITQSVYQGHAKRIGHGTDINYEKNNINLLKHMAKNHIAVEINLTSNKLILSIEGDQHPILYYLNHNVPIVLSTDDEGILETDLTSQFVDAVKLYKLSYKTIKNINRNALSYSFLPGKSIWLNHETGVFIPDCKILSSKKCLKFITNNQKAYLQWKLENELNNFEKKVPAYLVTT